MLFFTATATQKCSRSSFTGNTVQATTAARPNMKTKLRLWTDVACKEIDGYINATEHQFIVSHGGKKIIKFLHYCKFGVTSLKESYSADIS